MSFKKVFTYNKVHCTPLSTLNQNVEYIVASTRKNISKNLNEPRSSLHVQADLHGENQTLDRVPNAQSSEKTFSHLEYSASQKRKYIENQEIVSLATTIDGIETFVEEIGLLHDVPDTVKMYFDYDAYLRDLKIDSVHVVHLSHNKILVFNQN